MPPSSSSTKDSDSAANAAAGAARQFVAYSAELRASRAGRVDVRGPFQVLDRPSVALPAAQRRRCRVCTQAARLRLGLGPLARPPGVFRPAIKRRSRALPVNEPPSARAEGKDPMNSVNLTARLT